MLFTLDLEDHRPDDSVPVRYPDLTGRLLDDLDDWGVRGTVFVVGEVAVESPDLVRRVADRRSRGRAVQVPFFCTFRRSAVRARDPWRTNNNKMTAMSRSRSGAPPSF